MQLIETFMRALYYAIWRQLGAPASSDTTHNDRFGSLPPKLPHAREYVEQCTLKGTLIGPN